MCEKYPLSTACLIFPQSSDDDEESGSSDDSDSDDSDASESESKDKTEAKTEAKAGETEKAESSDEVAPKKRKALDDPDPTKWNKKAKPDASDKSSTLFVGSLAWAVDDDKLYEAFCQFNGLLGARVVTDKNTGRSRGFGYVDFGSPETAAEALEAMNGTSLEGRGMNIDFAASRSNNNDSNNFRERATERAKAHHDRVSPESETLFAGNLPFEVDDQTVREFFAEICEVVSVRLPTDP